MTGEEEGEGQGAQPELLPLTENPYKELSDDDLLPVMSEVRGGGPRRDRLCKISPPSRLHFYGFPLG